MMGFGSEDIQRNGGHYNPPGTSGYSSSNTYNRTEEQKWGNSNYSTGTKQFDFTKYGGSINDQEDEKKPSNFEKKKEKKSSSHKKKKKKRDSS